MEVRRDGIMMPTLTLATCREAHSCGREMMTGARLRPGADHYTIAPGQIQSRQGPARKLLDFPV